MGFLRKSLFVSTGGMSGLVFKANSKKERIAKAQEAQLRLMKGSRRRSPTTMPVHQSDAAQYSGELPSPRLATALSEEVRRESPQSLIEELRKLSELKREGLLNDDEFAAAKAQLLGR